MRRGLIAALALACVAVVTVLAPAPAHAATVPDPLADGPHRVARADYSLGDTAYSIPNFPGPSELTGDVFYPTDFRGMPYPIVMLLHGRHETCMTKKEPLADWPCPKGSTPIPSYRGYDYLARSLATHGCVVISISANGINAADATVTDSGMNARGELILKHLDLWSQWRKDPAAAPIPPQYLSEFDFTRIGLMGHSRGGEGIVAALEINRLRKNPYAIRAVLPLAPTDFDRRIPTGIPVGVMLGTCDGDVSDMEGIHYFDDGRYRTASDPAIRNVITIEGANHNYFNTAWSPSSGYPGAADDWSYAGGPKTSPCSPTRPTRLTEKQQRTAASAYIGSFFRYYLGGESAFAGLWNGSAPEPPGVAPATVKVSYLPAADARRDISRFDYETMDQNDLGGKLTMTGLRQVNVCGGVGIDLAVSCLSRADVSPEREPERGWYFAGLTAQPLEWTKPGAALTEGIPAKYGDVRSFGAVQFRAAVDFTFAPNGASQDLRVVLTDTAGHRASATVSHYSNGLRREQGNPSGADVVPHLLYNQVRVPLSAFAGVDRAHIAKVALVMDQKPQGRIIVSDLGFDA
ncbi:MAG TPA: hypothetical protein VHC49_02120 [Mycobacteriales bacterium]|nr:hypothetical protein [Mycobacteriales bacterium]